MRKFRLLRADEIECRIARVTGYGVQLLLYKTARTDATLLDETYPEQWQNDYRSIDGTMYCGIGIKIKDEWQWRWNCGVESNMEAKKGEASDAFKRAGFMWGIGAELYSSPRITIKPENCNIEGQKCNDYFEVTAIDYDEQQRIKYLTIQNRTQRKLAFTYGSPQATPETRPEPRQPEPEPEEQPHSDRDVNIKLCIAMAREYGRAQIVNEAGYNGTPWDQIADANIVKLKLWLVAVGKKGQAA